MKIVPINDISSISICWQISDVIKNSEYKAIQYISNLLGHESKGSILYALKKYGLATKLTAGIYEHNAFMGLFNVNIYLTTKGDDNIKNIIEMIYYYIELIKNNIDEKLYNEKKYISELVFKFLEKDNSMDYVKQLSSSMIYCKNIKYILYDIYCYKKFSTTTKEYINKYIDELTKYKSMVILSSKKYKNVATNVEKYYGTKYIIYNNDINSKGLDMDIIEKNIIPLKNLISELYIVGKNKYIPEKVDIIRKHTNKQKYPYQLDKKGKIELWYKFDTKYNSPFVLMTVIIYISPILISPQNYSSYNIYLDILNNYLTSEQYYMNLANASLNFINKYDVLEIKISAYPNIIFEIAQYAVHTFFNLEINSEMFTTEKTEYRRNLINNKNITPYLLCKKYFAEKNCYNIYSDESILEIIDSITINNVANIKNMFINKFRVKTYVHGNIEANDAIKLGEIFNIFSKFDIKKQYLSVDDYIIPPTFIKELGYSEEETYIKIIQNKHERNNAICIFYEIGNIKKNVTDNWIQQLLFAYITNNFLSEKFFNQLRTVEQLGYIVSCSVFTVGYIEEQMYGIIFLIQSPNKLPDNLKVRIKQFIVDQYDILDKFNDGNFNELIKTTISNLTKSDDNIYDEFNRNLNEIITGDYMFNIKNVYKQSSNALSLKKYKEMYYNYMINRNTRKIRTIKLYNSKSLQKN